MLLWRGGAAKPAIVGDVDEEVGAVDGEAPHFVGKNCFVTNEHAERETSGKLADGIVRALAEATNFVRKAGRDAMDQREGFVLAEWDEMHFIVGERMLAVSVEQDSAVIGSSCRMRIRRSGLGERLPVDHAGEKRMLIMNGEQRRAAPELRVFEGEGSGRFGPDEQIGLVVGGRETQAFDFLKLREMRLEPIGGIVHGLGKIYLHRAGVMLRWS